MSGSGLVRWLTHLVARGRSWRDDSSAEKTGAGRRLAACEPGEHVPGEPGDRVRVRKIDGRAVEAWTTCESCGRKIIHGKQTPLGRKWAWVIDDEREAQEIRRDDVAEWVTVDHIGVVIAGPFDTQDEAWDALAGTHAEGTGFAEPARWHETDWLEGP